MVRLADFDTAPTNTFKWDSAKIRQILLIVVVFPHPGGPLMKVILFFNILLMA